MTYVLLSAVFVTALWWASTVLVLRLNGLPARTFPMTLAVATLALAAGLWGLGATADDATVAGALSAFACAIVVWGWNELAFLTGAITGYRKRACGPGCRGLRRFGHATEAIIFHELALVASAIAILWLGAGGANRIGAATFGALWIMRLSSKLNIFLGVPNPGTELLPPAVAHLSGFFRERPMSPLFPVSVSALTIALGLLIYIPFNAAGTLDGHQLAGFALLATLVALGTLEHWLLVLPVPATRLWRHGLGSRGTAEVLRSQELGI
jgi:putative photosynthetic complex assembly protein 2